MILKPFETHSFNLKLQLKNIESAIQNKVKNSLTEMKEFKFIITLVLKLKKQ